MKLPYHDRYAYSPIIDRPDYSWPDGKRLALVSNLGSSAYRLWLADDPEDFQLSSAKQTAVRACKVTWRGDSKELLVVAGDEGCREDVAVIDRVPANDVRNQKELNPSSGCSSPRCLSKGTKRLSRRFVGTRIDGRSRCTSAL